MSPSFRTGIFPNLGLKLLSLLLACIVYAHVVTEKEREVDLVVPLKLARIPAGMTILGAAPHTIRVRARGTGKRLLWLKLFKIEARVSVAGAVPGRYERTFSPSDIALPPGSGVTVAEVLEPRNLSLDFDTVASRRVKVFPTVVGVPASGFAVAGTPSAAPDSVQVTGAKRLVEKIDLLRSVSVDISESREKTIARVPVDTRGMEVTVEPHEVTVEIAVERLSAQRFEKVPVEILRSSEIRRALSDPREGSVVVSGPESRLRGLDAGDIHLRLDARHLGAGRYTIPAQVDVDGGMSGFTVEPDRFLVTIE